MKKQFNMTSGIVALMIISLTSFAQVSHKASDKTPQEKKELKMVRKYLDIVFIENKKGKGLEKILSDQFDFHDPMTTASGAQDFIKKAQPWISVSKSYDMKNQIVEGNQVCSFYTINIRMPDGRTGSFVQADYVQFEGNKISKERVYLFDPGAFAKFMGIKPYLDRYTAGL